MVSSSRHACGGGNRGQFRYAGIGFVGFKFNTLEGVDYGWARVEMRGDNAEFRLIDYAYGDAGERVRAGQISSNDMVPEKGSLGGLALGAAGLLAWRSRRSRTAS
jgi:hypothetical protein